MNQLYRKILEKLNESIASDDYDDGFDDAFVFEFDEDRIDNPEYLKGLKDGAYERGHSDGLNLLEPGSFEHFLDLHDIYIDAYKNAIKDLESN